MIRSPYRTSVTAAHQDSGKRVEPDMTNRKAMQKAQRRELWLSKQKAKQAA